MFPRAVIPAGAVVLRPPAEADADAVAEGCADPEIARCLPIPPPRTRADALAWLGGPVERIRRTGGAAFTVADAASDRWLGGVALHPPGPHGAAEIGYLIAPWARGRGLAAAAARALAAWAFCHGLPRAEIRCDVANLPGQRVAMAAGFTREAVLRSAAAGRDGDRYDQVLFARLPGDSGEPVRPYLPPLPDGRLTDGVVRLTPLTAADADDYHALACRPEVVRYSVPPVPPAYRDTVRRCRHAGARWLAGEHAELVIRDAATGAFAGQVQLSNIAPPLGQAMVGYGVAAGYRGRGFATRAVRLLAGWAFTATPLARLVAGTAVENVASQRVLEKAGFTREAVLRGLLPAADGTRVDDVQWVLLRP